ncbi:amidohydrolase family protein [Actinomadura pelletieri]|nr:amidohydrolase family protein [Actinomadura pelletieri]
MSNNSGGMMSDALLLSRYVPRRRLTVPAHEVPRARFPAVDAHTHLGRWLSDWDDRPGEWMVPDVPALLDVMDERDIRSLVNLDGRWGAELKANLARYDAAHPGRFVTFCHVDWAELALPDGATRLVKSLTESKEAGAGGLKVWKDLGLEVRDGRGDLVLPDDPRLAALWDTAGELDLPVWIHTADPRAFFDPVDEHNELLEILLAHPEWSFARPGLPSFERLMDALEAVVAAHPRTTFVAVHGGGNAEDLGWVGRMLDTYPNLHIDIAARLNQLGRQPRATRALIMRHPDRVLFGTDEIPHTGAAYPLHFRFMETDDECFPYSPEEPPPMGRWVISGVHLPDDVLRLVYAGNAGRLLPGLAR